MPCLRLITETALTAHDRFEDLQEALTRMLRLVSMDSFAVNEPVTLLPRSDLLLVVLMVSRTGA
jgi:hypothetical protein